MKPLILGNGLLGSEIRKQTAWRCLDRSEFDIKKDLRLYTDSDDWQDSDIVINCIGYTKTYDDNYRENWDINYKAVSDLIKFCNESEKRLVQISTDYLYTGSIENATEEDLPVPVATWYGYTKLLADGLVQLQCNDYLICRGTHKPYPFPYEVAWTNQIGNFDYVNVIAKLIIKLIEGDATGLYNVGTEKKSMYELAQRTKRVKGVTCPMCIVPKNVTMNASKLNKFL